MTSRKVTTAISAAGDRYLPAEALTQIAKGLAASDVVDDMLIWDQLTSWWPQSLWTEANTPLAAVKPDCDSYADAFALSGHMLANGPSLGVAVSTDAMRRGPAEMLQSMLTLSNFTDRTAILQLGAGELKQCKPFGYKRSQGLERLEDHFRIYRELLGTDGPVDHQGNIWNFNRAWIGGAKQKPPRLWALGGGPRLLDIATSYADGLCSVSPYVWSSPEQAAKVISDIKHELERKGRDPEDFDFGLWVIALAHDDPAMIDRAMDNALMKWLTAGFGRFNQADWLTEGIEPVFPPEWHYAVKLEPVKMSAEETQQIVDQVTPEMARKSWVSGTPAEIAAEIADYVEAGVTWVSVCDVLPLVLPPDDPATVFDPSIEICRLLKA